MARKVVIRFLSVLALMVSIATSDTANAVITVSYGPFDVRFYGISDGAAQDWTAEQMADVAASIATWDSRILNTPGRQIIMDLSWVDFGGGILGGSYSPTYGDGTTSWSYAERIWRDGLVYDGLWDGWDTQIMMDANAAGYGWNFGLDSPSANEIDFRSVMTHELGHSLGFRDTYDYDYDDWGNVYGSASNPYAWVGWEGLSAWDQNLVDSSGNRPIVGNGGTSGSLFNEVDNPVYFDGANAVAHYGDDVPIYAPAYFAPGSSLSHLDDDTFYPTTGALMLPFISLGESGRAPTELEWDMMKDMGWSIASVPEPTTLAIWSGLGIMGLIGVRRRRKQAASAKAT